MLALDIKHCGFAFALVLVSMHTVWAQQEPWPVKPIRVIVPFSPGTPIEVPTRAVTRKMTEAFGQQFVFDYRTGAGGTIGTAIAARSPKDGYTLLATNCSHSANPSYYRKLPYDTLSEFAPISQINLTYGNLLVIHPSLPPKSVKEFIALAKTRPGEIKYASGGVGSPPHVSAALFAAMSGIRLVHIPYKGTAPAMSDLLSGQIESMVISPTIVVPYLQAGRLRALGIGGPRRQPQVPEIPTFHESGLTGFDMTCYHGLWFPAGVANDLVRRVYGEVAKAVALPETRKYLADNGLIPTGTTPEEFAEFLRKDVIKQADIVRQIGLQPQ